MVVLCLEIFFEVKFIALVFVSFFFTSKSPGLYFFTRECEG